MVDRGLIDGPHIGRLKTAHHIDTIVPLKKNMDAYQDMLGLTRLKDFQWEPYQAPYATRPDQPDRPKHPTIVKREQARQRKLAEKKGSPPPKLLPQPQTLQGTARGVTSWTDCTVPLTWSSTARSIATARSTTGCWRQLPPPSVPRRSVPTTRCGPPSRSG